MRLHINKKTSGGFIIVFIIMLSIGIVSYLSFVNSNRDIHNTVLSFKTATAIETVLSLVKDIETGQRGYIIAGNEEYLDPYYSAKNKMPGNLYELRELVTDAEQSMRLDTLEQMINRKINISERNIEIRKKLGFSEVEQEFQKNLEQIRMNNIREVARRMKTKEAKILQAKNAQLRKSKNITTGVIILGNVIGIVILFIVLYLLNQDIQKRKTAEQNLLTAKQSIEESKRLHQALLDNIPSAIFIKNISGRFLLVNKQYEKIFNLDGEQIINKTDHDIFPKEIADQNRVDELKVIASKKVFLKEHTIPSQESTNNYITHVFPVFDNEGNVYAVASISTDITERKNSEKALLKAKEIAEQSVIAKERFLANMSHEIRTPMNAVIGFGDILIKTKLDTDQQQYVQSIITSGENLMTIINDILDYSKIEAGMMTIEQTTFSIRSIFSSLTTLLEQKARKKNISFLFQTDSNIPEIIIGDPTRLNQIIINLVGNAIKFTETGGIEISTRIVNEENDIIRVEFRVKDSGIGIPENKLNDIFERFNQVSTETTRKFGGTGLGLSIVENLVKLQGGTISASSELGKGSVFTFVIPYKKATKNEIDQFNAEKKQSDVVNLGKLKVLLVEDNKINQQLASLVLLNFGFETELADNGKIAVEKLKTNKFDLVLMDMQMPEMDGYEASQIIRTELKNNIPIIAMTAHAMANEKEKCLGFGMNDYIAKPFKADHLYHIISKLFEKNISKKIASTNISKEINTNTGVIDLTYLIEMLEGNKKFIKEVIELFIKNIPPDLILLEEAIKKQNFIAIKDIAHKLRSSVPLMGLENELDPVLSAMEEKGKSKMDIEDIRLLYTQLYTVCSKALIEAETEKSNYS